LEVVVILLLFTLSISIFSMNVTYLVTDEILLLSFFVEMLELNQLIFILKIIPKFLNCFALVYFLKRLQIYIF
ncbi:hypothetical protein LNI94_06655, partial [Tenacibaculum finnmarkense genomovar ulcerans]|uniref:hypothetical protein n=1 Tax=Tenacibaculum finnmarkense TaxID=2781243 RepID=UPI001E36DFB9